MNSTPSDAFLEDLLEKLNGGDDEAAGKVFVRYEPYLRMVVRRQLSGKLRAKLDSIDVVHSIWADVLSHFRECGCCFVSPEHLRAFLLKAVRNRLIDRMRQHRKAVECERPLAEIAARELPVSPEPRPSETVRAHELWEKLLSLCAPAHRGVLRLKRQGYSPVQIAALTGYNPGTIYRILSELALQFAAAAPGDQGKALA